MDRNLLNVILAGVAFCLLFMAFQTASMTAPNVLEAAAREGKGTFSGVGYICFAIVYISFAFFNWFAPIVVLYLGKKYSMFFGSLCYGLFIGSFLEPRKWSLYLVSCINGIGAAVLWTAQGAFISDCSRRNNVNKNFSLFWGVFQFNLIVGGIYAYASLAKIGTITRDLRLHLYGGLLGCSLLGSLMFLFLRPPHLENESSTSPVVESQDDVGNISSQNTSRQGNIYAATFASIRRSFKMLRSTVMLAILAASAFTGVNLTFFSSLYTTCLGHTQKFGDNAKSYIGLAGLFVGLGELAGSFGSHLIRWLGSDGLILVFGYFPAVVAAYVMFLMLPANSPIMDTNEFSYIEPNIYVAVLIAFVFGLVDCLWSTQISALISSIFRSDQEDVLTAFALFKFVQSVLCAATFAYGTHLLLQWQVFMYICWASIGMICFYYAHRRYILTQGIGVTRANL